MMTAIGRAQAMYNAVVGNNPAMAKLNAAEKQAMVASFQAICGADVLYLTSAMTVNPGTLVSPAGQAVSVAGPSGPQVGATTAASPLAGTGTVS